MFVPISLGADPEVFLKKGKGYPPSFKAKKIGGKSKPGDWGGGFYYRDGWAVELAPLPSSCREILLYRLFRGLQEVKQVSGFNLSTKPVIPISLKQLEGDHVPADMLAFGCDPAFDAYEDGAQIDPGVEALKHPFRYAGGHIHLGIGSIKNPISPEVVKGMRLVEKGKDEEARAFFSPYIQQVNLLAGLVGVVLWNSPSEKQRRKVYGRAGEFRVQDYKNEQYGLEFRTPSPRWLMHSAAASLMLGLSRAAIYNHLGIRGCTTKFTHPPSEVRDIINEADGVEAEKVVRRLLKQGSVRDYGTQSYVLLSNLKYVLELRDLLAKRGDETGLTSNSMGFREWSAEARRKAA
jgi:hypothetical protein